MTTHLPVSHCPRCGALLDAATSLAHADFSPRAGDASVCIDCAAVLVFTPELAIRLATDDELAELMLHQELVDTIFALQAWNLAGRPGMQ